MSELAVHDAIVPEIWAYEIADIIFISFRKRGRITHEQIAEYLKRLRALPIRVERSDLWANVALESRACEWDIAAYDASYLDLALRKGLPLATADDRLREAAVAAGIALLG